MARLLFLQNIEYEFMGPMYVSAAIKKHGHECELVLGTTLEDFDEAIERFKPDIVGFSIMTGSHFWALDIARQVKAKYEIRNVFGGAHPTFFPDFVKEQGVDLIVRGEGEFAAIELMDSIDNGTSFEEIKNLGYMKDDKEVQVPLRPLPQDLDAYPFPDRHLYDALEGKIDRSTRNLITSRGCPFKCSFCFEESMREMYKGLGKYVRMRSIDKVIEECKVMLKETDATTIYFCDDLFGMNRKWMYDFLEVYKREIGVDFVCLVRADLVSFEPEYAQRMADAGCKTVFFGVESGNEEIRNKVLAKKLTDEQIIKGAQYLHDAGIKFRTYNILGLPGESLEDALSTVELNVKIGTDYPWASIFSPLPGVPLTQYAIDHGYLDADYNVNKINKSFFLDNSLKSDNKNEIQNLQKFFQTAVWFPWTMPIIRQLIKLKPNFLFTAWFGLFYFINFVRSEKRGFFSTLTFALKNWRYVLTKE